jgi:PAS domain S-box-containing protein
MPTRRCFRFGAKSRSREPLDGGRATFDGTGGLSRDEGDRNQVQEALGERGTGFKPLMDHLPYPVLIAEPTGKILYLNPALTELYGYGLADVPDRETWRRKVFPDPEHRRLVARESLWGKTDKPRQRKVERRITCRDGTIREVEIYSTVMPDGYIHFVHYDLTERVRAEASLKESEARFRLLAENSPFPVLIAERTGRIIYVSPVFNRRFGYTLDDIPDRETMRARLFPDPEYRRQVAQKSFWGKEGYPEQRKVERRITCRDGSIRDLVVYAIDLPDGNLYFIHHDVTEQKRAEAALKESETRFRLLTEHSPLPVQLISPEDKILYLSPSFTRVFGYSLEEIPDRKTMREKFFPDPEYRRQVVQELGGWEYSPDRQVAQSERRISCKDGQVKETSIFRIKLPDKSHYFILQDITARKRAEEKLKASEESYRNIFGSINDCICTHDLEGRLTSLNPAAVVTMGYREEELLGHPIQELIDPDHRDKFISEYMNPLLKEGRAKGILKLISRDGSPHYIEYNCSLVRQEGKEDWVSCVGRDVTDRILGERKLRELEEQLQQAQKMEAIGTLAGGVAHDFNNILGAIIGYAELGLDRRPEKGRTDQYLEQIHQAGIRARDLVKQILTFSRKSEQQLVPLDVIPLIKETLKFLRSSLPTTIDIKLENRLKKAVILADPTQIHQILMNLSTNSGQAMKEGGGTLEIRLAELELGHGKTDQGLDLPAGRYLELNVADNGQGMDPATLERIFEPYFTTKEQGEGTGLGLAVVHGIVMSYGGEIRVESKPGQGSVFRVYLPLHQEQDPKELVAEEAVPPTGQERILLVDDEKALVDLNSQLLERLGYRVTGLTSSQEALELFGQDPQAFDLVITDQTMPRLTGVEMSKEMMSLRPDLPIILCTGYSDRVSPETVRKMGIKDFLLKPMVKSDLAQAIRQALEGRVEG